MTTPTGIAPRLEEACSDRPLRVLGIESSCDETGVALVEVASAGPGSAMPLLLAHALHSQIDMHQAYGGVVPELASRDHIRRVVPLLRETLSRAELALEQVDVVAYTQGPGLAGALLVGAGFGCALGLALDRPVMTVHHLEGHLLSPFLSADPPEFPFVALLVSGGHTQLMRVDGVGRYELLGETIDDAAGEAFDKTAKLLGLGYPGGPALARLAEFGDAAMPLRCRDRCCVQPATWTSRSPASRPRCWTQLSRLACCCGRTADEAAAGRPGCFHPGGHRRRAGGTKSLAALKLTGLKRLVVAGGVGANRRLREPVDASSAVARASGCTTRSCSCAPTTAP
jgi:N6-L-threonylcarbamoyladenine synthase